MKIRLFLCLGIVFCSFCDGMHAAERKQAVMVGLVNGTEIRFRLDHIDENKVIGLKSGSQKVILSRSEISWMRFRPEIHTKVPPGEEGMVLSDGTIIKASPIWMDEQYYWIEDENFKRKRIEQKKVIFIQLANSKDAIRIASAADHAVAVRVRVAAQKAWTASNLTVRQGQQIWFTVADDSLSYCFGLSPAATAIGVANESDAILPVPSANACSLIGKIGEQGKPFEIGSQRKPVIAESSGKLFLGVNDKTLENNTGQFDVFVKITLMEENTKSSAAAPEEKNDSNHP